VRRVIGNGRAGCGVVVGKFNPPHLGHLHLIEQGAARVERLYVLLCDRPDQSIPVALRRQWLEDAVPSNVSVLVTPDDIPTENEPWARRALEVLPEAPDLAFTSEEWGPGWAALMGAEHVMVDLARAAFPVSGSRLRADLRAHFEWLVPSARAGLARRVVLIGAESSGKSTLAEALAAELGTVWVPEQGRTYWEGRRHLVDQPWSTEEFRRIAHAQRRSEDDLARKASKGVVVADTDALVTAVWHERYMGCADPELDAFAAGWVPDLYLVCCPDFGWVQDGTRESEAHREAMHASMERRARRSGARVVTLPGPHELRLRTALAAIEEVATFGELV
jgi:HTH-type transcriptional regulator, transcriptional repressor of NAD biosynthesis genes